MWHGAACAKAVLRVESFTSPAGRAIDAGSAPRAVQIPSRRCRPDLAHCTFTTIKLQRCRQARRLELINCRVEAAGAGAWRSDVQLAAALNKWLLAQRQLVPDGSATAKAIDYSLKPWQALTHCIDDGDVPISNNWVENQIRPIALGRSNWLFAGSLRAGKRAAAIMSLVHSAKINGHDPHAYLNDVLQRLPTQPASRIEDLMPHRWTPLTTTL